MNASRARSRLVALALVVLAGAGACRDTPQPARSHDPFGTGKLTLRDGSANLLLEVEVADTPETRSRGLMGRRALAPHRGMVFVFDQPTVVSFWMKDTLIPLTIAFWDAHGRVLAVLDMTPCRTDPCPLYGPGQAYVAAVEVAKGVLQANGIGVGATVRLDRSAGS